METFSIINQTQIVNRNQQGIAWTSQGFPSPKFQREEG